MSGPERTEFWEYPSFGKVRLTGKPVSAVKIEKNAYRHARSFVPGKERVSQPWPPQIRKQKGKG